MFGKEGKRTDYTPYSCMKVILSNLPSQGDHHGELTEEAVTPRISPSALIIRPFYLNNSDTVGVLILKISVYLF